MHPAQDRAAPAPADRRPRIRRRLRTPVEAQQWRRKIAGYALYATAFILIVNALVGDSGYLATLGGKSAQDRATRELAALRQRNQELQDQADRLRNDPAAVEEAARRKLNMIKPGEVMVVIKDQPAKQ
jgi:cell division protein FtsB